MQKIISVFQRNYESDRLVRNEVVPGAEWVLAGEGVATRKWDGACCMIRGRKLYKRYELKSGKTPPPGFEPSQEPDPVTKAIPGWLPVGAGPEDQWFRAARTASTELYDVSSDSFVEGTFEAVGPHFGGGHHVSNPEGFVEDRLVLHGREKIPGFPRDFDGIRDYFANMVGIIAQIGPATVAIREFIEGVVFHHPDGRMAKVKAKDFGIRRP